MQLDKNSTVALCGGAEMPLLGLGVWQVEDQAQLEGAIKAALDCGYLLIDTAAAYFNEEMVGRAIKKHGDRSRLFLTTKLWNADQGDPAAALDSSLKKLETDYVDLYLIHWPKPQLGLYVEAWLKLIELQKSGKARAIGVSNFNEPHLASIIEASGVVPAVNQLERHPFFQRTELAAHCRELGIVTQAYSPLGSGMLGEMADSLAPLAKKHGKSVAQLVLRWQLETGWPIIPKSVTPSRIAENADIFDFSLDAEDISAIAALDCGRRVLPDPELATF